MANLGWRDQRNKDLNLAKSSRSLAKDFSRNNERNLNFLKKIKERKLNREKEVKKD